MRRLDSHARSLSSKVDHTVYEIEISGIKGAHEKEINAVRVAHDRDVEALKEDFSDLRNSYRQLVRVAVTEAIGLLIAIVLISVQIALSFSAGG